MFDWIPNSLKWLTQVFPTEDAHRTNLIADFFSLALFFVFAVAVQADGPEAKELMYGKIGGFVLVMIFIYWCIKTHVTPKK